MTHWCNPTTDAVRAELYGKDNSDQSVSVQPGECAEVASLFDTAIPKLAPQLKSTGECMNKSPGGSNHRPAQAREPEPAPEPELEPEAPADGPSSEPAQAQFSAQNSSRQKRRGR